MAISSSFAPGYLVASPNLKDPNFAETLVLMAEHNAEGALGFIVNRGTGLALGTLLHGIDEGLAEAVEGTELAEQEVLWGGPVQPNMVWLLYALEKGEVPDESSLLVGEALAVGATVELLSAFLLGERSGPFHVILGYAGWGSEQLESETVEGAWLPLGPNDGLIFATERDARWTAAVRDLGLTPGGFIMGGSGGLA